MYGERSSKYTHTHTHTHTHIQNKKEYFVLMMG